jgi:glycosyltransferase involved in cell wall biosynthesis
MSVGGSYGTDRETDQVKPNVLIYVENLAVPFDRRVWMEANTLQRNGYQVHIICPRSKQHPRFKEEIDGIRIYRYPPFIEGRTSLGTLLEYAWAIFAMGVIAFLLSCSRKFKIVHVCNPPDILFIAAWAPRSIWKAKLIFDQHDINPELWESKGHSKSDFFGKLLMSAERATYRRAITVISTNESYKEIAINRGGKSPKDVFVVRSAPKNSFAVDLLPITRSAQDAHKIVYIGTMGHQEGIDILVKSINILVKKMNRTFIQLDLIGDGPERRYLENLATELGVNHHIKFHGRVSDDDLRTIVLDADIAVNPDRPSKMNDLSSMNKIVEYMALGRPIVQFACVEGERTALEAAISVRIASEDMLAESLSELLEDENARSYMSIYGLERFKSALSWEFQESQLISAYVHGDSL